MERSARKLTLVVLAAGLSTRYGKLKQLESVGPRGEALMDYGVFDAMAAGFNRVIFVVRPEIEYAVKTHVQSLLHGSVETLFVHQTLDNVPNWYQVPTNRTKPWGTAHAVLAAEHHIEGPFAVCNSDDFYGASAYSALADFLTSSTPNQYALVGYRLDITMSDSGGVSRAVCTSNSAGLLNTIAEVKGLVREGSYISGRTIMGHTRSFSGEETVSMNLWGFSPTVLPGFHDSFARFLETTGHNENSEYLIPDVVAHLVEKHNAQVKILDAGTEWMGVTFPADRETVTSGITEMIGRGYYPDDLASWFKLH